MTSTKCTKITSTPTTTIIVHPSPTPAPSPPLREALPLLILGPTRYDEQESCDTAMEVDMNKGKEKTLSSSIDDETVTVALYLGLSSPSSTDG